MVLAHTTDLRRPFLCQPCPALRLPSASEIPRERRITVGLSPLNLPRKPERLWSERDRRGQSCCRVHTRKPHCRTWPRCARRSGAGAPDGSRLQRARPGGAATAAPAQSAQLPGGSKVLLLAREVDTSSRWRSTPGRRPLPWGGDAQRKCPPTSARPGPGFTRFPPSPRSPTRPRASLRGPRSSFLLCSFFTPNTRRSLREAAAA